MADPVELSDSDVQDAVMHELRWIPGFNQAKIRVTVAAGVVTLTGHVVTYPEELWAERATRRVHGVTGLVLQLTVGDPHTGLSDAEIATVAQQELSRAVDVPASVAVLVEDQIVTLSGEVPWQWQKLAASRTVQYLKGVSGVHNDIAVVPNTPPLELRTAIEAAFARSAQLDSLSIAVTTDEHGSVGLRGVVDTWAKWRQAEHACWAAPGVKVVDNQLRVQPASTWPR